LNPTATTTLSERTMSGFPVSIGTGLALETLFLPVTEVIDPDRVAPPKIVKDAYSTYLINASTLIRNLLSSVTYKDLVTHSPTVILDTLLEEIEYLSTLFQIQDMHMGLYVNTYEVATKRHQPNVRLISTENQKHIQHLTDHCLKHLRQQDDVQHFTDKLIYDQAATMLVLTHIPWDLLSHSKVNKLDLLESHTGVVKSRKDWNTKYHKLGDRDLSMLPFTEELLVLFGDSIMFKPQSVKLRTDKLDELIAKGVHPLMGETTLNYLLGKT
jgi:hypothetical protein